MRQSAGLGDSQAMLALGAFEAERDRNALQPGHAARDWYLKAGDAGSAEAWYRLAELDMAKLADGQRPGSQVFAWYRRAMSAGHDPAAARYLDLNLRFAMDAKLDRAATLKQLRERSTQGNVAAMVVLGRVYADPQLAEHDDREATFWFERAAGAGNVDALLEQARMAGEGRGEPADLVKAHALTRQAAERGSPRGMLLLARQLQQGRGVAADPAAALIWFRRAAAAGETEALSDLGHAAENGVGRDRDRDEAVALYRRAAALGDPIGTRHLAVVFEHGVGVRRNVDRAIALYRRAAGQGDARAQASLAVLANNGLLTSFPDPVQGAAGLTKVLDTARDGDYTFKLAQMVEKGIGVPADPARAVRLYRRAANEGSAAAASELAAMYKLGSGVEQDVPRAVGLWQQAALAGDSAASYNLAVSYAERNDGPQDLAEAARWARRSAESGNAEAMTLHARHRYLGTPGQPADVDAAFDWLTRALEARNGWAAGTLVALATGQGDLPTTTEVRERALFVLVDAMERTRSALAAQALRQVYEASTEPGGQRATLAMLQARLDGPERGRALMLLGGAVAEGRLGDAPDPVRAAQHYRDAIAAGEPLAHRFLGDLIAEGKLPGIPIERAIDAYRAGEQAGDAAAANNLGVAYLDGVGGEPDRDAAFESFRMAAENGLPGGMYNLAVAYQRGYGVRTSLEQAEQWYERAVARGHVAARLGLVSVLLNEQPESRDYSRAFWHLADLGRQGSPQAVQALGEVVRNGKLSSGVRGRALAIVTRLAQQENVDVAARLLDDLVQRRDIRRAPDGGYRVAASRGT
ncbi:tetratricopeptide repeat protein [Verticiella alkaliphila]|uniref:tetratricopeptide repeat protein n=1 Tax=Verticiella alkaliphila TaxID=2779529 RepID=UPI001C0BC3A7|nr:tetratricopeptide repeat protein [Verticiella sp. GG226]